MGAFTPFKRHAKEFNYKPRYYDPTKEAREQRRAELRGERRDQPTSKEGYQPGQYIRNSIDARNSRLQKGKQGSRTRLWIMIGIICVLLYFGTLLYNTIVRTFNLTEGGATRIESVEEEEAFNPYAPITIVPNDYVEE